MLKVNNKDTRMTSHVVVRCPLIVNFEQISHIAHEFLSCLEYASEFEFMLLLYLDDNVDDNVIIDVVLVFLLLTVNIFHNFF